MSNLHAIADRFEIEALRAEFTDALMMGEYNRLASLFTQGGAVRISDINAEAVSREEIRAAVERLQDLWEYFVQTTHPGAIQLEGDTASGRAYIFEFGRFHDGCSQVNYGVYHDRYKRTPEGWSFAQRVYEVRYVDRTPGPDRYSTHWRHSPTRRPGTSARPLEVDEIARGESGV